MGPQLVRCGKLTSSLPRIRVLPVCFNGAATCSLRKAVFLAITMRAKPELQWGRNLFVAESWSRQVRSRAFLASMGPQLVRCGKAP